MNTILDRRHSSAARPHTHTTSSATVARNSCRPSLYYYFIEDRAVLRYLHLCFVGFCVCARVALIKPTTLRVSLYPEIHSQLNGIYAGLTRTRDIIILYVCVCAADV